MLCNAMGRGGGVNFPGKLRRCNVVSVTRGWVGLGVKFPVLKRYVTYVTLEWPLIKVEVVG